MHHIDDKGRDSGVVYSEMQGRQNTSGDLMSLEYVVYILGNHSLNNCILFFGHDTIGFSG